MNWEILLHLVITTAVAVVSWVVGHALNTKRDLEKDRRATRPRYLIEAYRNLEGAANRGKINGTHFAPIVDSAVADIQFLGTKEQAQMTTKFIGTS